MTWEARFAIMEHYLQASVDYLGEAIACRIMRSRLGWFVKGLPHNRDFREAIKHLASQAEALERIRTYRARVLPLEHRAAREQGARPQGHLPIINM